MQKIWAHTLVKNEERYVWYAVMSVIEHVDKILIWDTGSTDDTIKIVKYIHDLYPQKVEINLLGEVNISEFTHVRNDMLKETEADWFMILDGDEVWWEDDIQKMIAIVRKEGEHLDSIVNRYTNIVGDIYHFQPESAGKYMIDDITGFLTIRCMNRTIPGLTISKPHGQQGVYDGKGRLIQNRNSQRRFFMNKSTYLHFTNVVRSESKFKDLLVPKRKIKLKYEIGRKFPADFYYPEVFFRPRPDFIYYPFITMSSDFFVKALVQTPLRRIKRYLYEGKSGY